jgi:hypothetical protein
MKLKLLMTSCLAMGITVSACGDVGDADTSSPNATSKMALNVDLQGGTDVSGFKFTAVRVHCGGSKKGQPVYPREVHEAKESLEEAYLPGDNATFENRPYDEYSEHHFSDHLFSVPHGCYDLEAKPITKKGKRSEDCAVATLRKQKAIKDAFNEFHLISQCRGRARTSLDVIASLNHPPEVKLDVEKFMCAGAGVRVCATAWDPNDDPLRFYWEGEENGCFIPVPDGRPTYDKKTGKTRHCVTIPSRVAESKKYKVTVKDLGWDGRHKKPIEQLLPEQDGQGFDASRSRASLIFKTHALGECIEQPAAFIGTTLGADLKSRNDDTPNTSRGMNKGQATKLAGNAIEWVNPNKLGDKNPPILLVRDTSTTEDEHEDNYIERRLKDAGYTNVVRIDEPAGGLRRGHTVGFKIIWFVNPGFPIDDERSYDTLLRFRKQGGGVIISGDDANQSSELTTPRTMSKFSFLKYLSNNGTSACGMPTDNNTGKNYLVKLIPNTPLTKGMSDLDFPYGNDIDRNRALDKGEIVAAYTKGLTVKPRCIGYKVPVMTAIPANTSLY